jgi:hypothetical protein
MAIMMVLGTSAYALDKKDGVYQIGSAEDYIAFVELVNGGERNANAILTADIDLGTYNTKIATNNSNYLGIFDGAGHTITIDLSEGTDGEGPALFRSIDQCSIIKRLKVQGTLRAGKYKHTAAIANYSSGIIRDCYVDVHVEASFADGADASIGGIAGQLNKLSVLENCLSKIKITGSTTHKCGGIAAWVDAQRANISNCLVINDEESNFNWSDGKSAGLVRDGDDLLEVLNLEKYNEDSYKNRPTGASANNYVTNDWGKLGKAATVVSSADVASGKVCYQLNSDQSQIRWVQRIGTDPYPVPAVFGTGRVYASAATNCQGMADGAITYSNTGSDTATKHTYDKYGVCTTCGQFNWNAFDFNDPERFDISDKSFLISSGSDLFLAETWNRFQNGCKFNLKLTNDVECKPEPGQVIFNTNDWIESNFNGQGHTLTIEMVDINEESAAFFPKPYANKGDFVFENVIMHGKVSSAYTKKGYVGSIASREYGSGSNKMIYRNVYSDVEVSVATEGDNTSAGFLGVADRTTVFENCIYAGNVNCVEGGGGVAGIVGWANGSTTTLTNCAFIGTLNNAGDGSTTLIRNYNTQTYKNVYSLNSYVDEGENSKFTLLENEDAIKSGELAYLLNGREEGLDRFYQKIGEDPVPMPFKKEGALVYTTAENYGCDGKPIGDVTYSNTYSAIVPSHQYSDGMCTICGHLEENYVPLVDGWYEIGNAAQFMWWARYAAEEDLSASARLTADIDMEEYSATYPDRTYPQIGNETTPFYGNFDGQYHTISNLEINLPGKRGAGLIGVMNSQPSNGFGGLSADDARAAEGVFVKNVVLDETCSILGQGYTGVVGMAANWPGHITISGVLNMGDATVDGGTNGAGLFGCAMGSNCHMTISNCGFIGNIHVLNNTQTENGSFSGWLGSYAEVTNCFSMGTVEYPDPHRSWARHPAGANIVIKNCYGLEGSDLKEFNDDAETKPDDVTFIPKEEIESGALAWKANGAQFRNSVWYQNIEEDENPSPIPSHGLVIYGAEKYFSALADGDIPGIASEIGSYEEGKAEDDYIVTQALLDNWKAVAEALGETTTISAFADAFDTLNAAKAAVQENAAVYQAYIDKCEEVKAFLMNDKTFSGNIRTALEAYLTEIGEPDEENPLGTYNYIVDEHTATAEEIQAEIERVDEWLKHAIAEDYVPGTDISWLIPNSDFAKKNTDYWTGAWCNAYGTVKDKNKKDIVGVEAWNRKGDMYQTVEGMKPGYYLIGLSGAFRPSNNRYSTNYAAGVYANGVFNYFPTVVEDYIAVKDTMDQVNCNLHGQGALDLAIYDDFASTSEEQAEQAGAELLGFAVQGPYGMAAAANAERYQAYTIAYVGEDGELTLGIKSQGTGYKEDWTGWGPLKVTYCGEEAGDALDTVLKNMKARALSIITYTIAEDIDNPAASPNFPAEMRNKLQKVIDTIDGAVTVEDKADLVKQFSELFQNVYEGKCAYISLYKQASKVEGVVSENLPLVAKNAEGEWDETGEMVFDDALYAACMTLFNAFREGKYSIEEALNPSTTLKGAEAEAYANCLPEVDEEGYYLISTPQQFVTYRALFINDDHAIKAKLVNDIDMIGIGMKPFGNNTEGNDDKGINYNGTLDGQGHALENVYIKFLGGRGCALFYELDNATVKNLKLTGEYYGDMQRMGGLTRYTSGSTKIENCEIAVVMHNAIEGDATTGGIMGCSRGGGNVVVKDCIVNCSFIADKAFSFGGVCGWRDGNLTLTNVLILSQYDTAQEPTSYPSDVLARNGCTVNNVYYAERSLIPGAGVRGTQATDEQLASGEICYKLNGSNQGVDAVWYQTLGEDATPVLDKTHKLVLYDEVNGYHNMTKDEEDAIESLTPTRPKTDGAIYNLAGQRVSKAQKGLYIIDGKKIYVK